MRPLFLLAPALLALPACTTLGERAGGGCPAGQTCSTETPAGLEFSADDFGDDWFGNPGVKPIAIGGSETISAWDHETGDALAVPYTASIVGDQLAIAGTSGNQIQVDSLGPTTEELELRDSQGALLDRVPVESHAIAAVGLTEGGYTPTFRRDEGAIELYQGARLRLTVTLQDADGERLFDQGMTISPDAASVISTWDSFDLEVPPTGVSATVTAGDLAPVELALPATTTIDSIDADPWFSTPPPVGSTQLVCFHAHVVDAELVGAPWQFTIDGPAHVDGDAVLFSNCASVVMDGVGAVTVTGAVGDQSASLDVTVVAAKQAAKLERPSRGTASLGERALTPAE